MSKSSFCSNSQSVKSLGEFDESLVWIPKIKMLQRLKVFEQRKIGQLLTKLKRDQEALDCFNLNLQINSNDSQILGELGACLIKLGKLDEAEECFNQAIKMDPNNQWYKNQLERLQKQIIN